MTPKNPIAVWLRAFDRASASITPALLAMQDLHEIFIRHDPVARAALEALADSQIAVILERAKLSRLPYKPG
jgi:hypothetical protein